VCSSDLSLRLCGRPPRHYGRGPGQPGFLRSARRRAMRLALASSRSLGGRRTGRALAAVMLAGGAALAQLPVLAAESRPSVELQLLQRMRKAARSLDYAGVYTYQPGSTVSSTQILHVVDGTGERERVALLDGQPREYIRHNEVTQCLLPDHKVVLKERRDSERFPAVLFDVGDHFATLYELRLQEPSERVAGRKCQVLEL